MKMSATYQQKMKYKETCTDFYLQIVEELIPQCALGEKYSTRRADKFHMEKVDNSKGSKSIIECGLVLFNELPL